MSRRFNQHGYTPCVLGMLVGGLMLGLGYLVSMIELVDEGIVDLGGED